MKKLKKLILLSASLLVLLFSLAASKPSSAAISFQNKTIEYHFASIVDDDLDDDYVGHDYHFTTQLIAELIPSTENNHTSHDYFQSIATSLPCYLRVRNLRI